MADHREDRASPIQGASLAHAQLFRLYARERLGWELPAPFEWTGGPDEVPGPQMWAAARGGTANMKTMAGACDSLYWNFKAQSSGAFSLALERRLAAELANDGPGLCRGEPNSSQYGEAHLRGQLTAWIVGEREGLAGLADRGGRLVQASTALSLLLGFRGPGYRCRDPIHGYRVTERCYRHLLGLPELPWQRQDFPELRPRDRNLSENNREAMWERNFKTMVVQGRGENAATWYHKHGHYSAAICRELGPVLRAVRVEHGAGIASPALRDIRLRQRLVVQERNDRGVPIIAAWFPDQTGVHDGPVGGAWNSASGGEQLYLHDPPLEFWPTEVTTRQDDLGRLVMRGTGSFGRRKGEEVGTRERALYFPGAYVRETSLGGPQPPAPAPPRLSFATSKPPRPPATDPEPEPPGEGAGPPRWDIAERQIKWAEDSIFAAKNLRADMLAREAAVVQLRRAADHLTRAANAVAGRIKPKGGAE